MVCCGAPEMRVSHRPQENPDRPQDSSPPDTWIVCSGMVFRHGFHFPSASILSRTRNAVILRIRGRGSGFSSGNWIDALAVANFERSFAKALTADGVG